MDLDRRKHFCGKLLRVKDRHHKTIAICFSAHWFPQQNLMFWPLPFWHSRQIAHKIAPFIGLDHHIIGALKVCTKIEAKMRNTPESFFLFKLIFILNYEIVQNHIKRDAGAKQPAIHLQQKQMDCAQILVVHGNSKQNWRAKVMGKILFISQKNFHKQIVVAAKEKRVLENEMTQLNG